VADRKVCVEWNREDCRHTKAVFIVVSAGPFPAAGTSRRSKLVFPETRVLTAGKGQLIVVSA